MVDWVGFVPAAILVSLIPGANQLLGLRNAVRHGRTYALAGIGGRLAAFVVLIGLVVAGLGTVLATSAAVLDVIRWAGVVYLGWLGVACLNSARRASAAGVRPAPLRGGGLRTLVTQEFLVAIGNPKALLLFAALLPQFTDGSAMDVGVQLGLLGAAYLLIEFIVGVGYIGVGGRIGDLGLSSRVQQRIDIGTGIGFLGMAGLLAVDDLPRP